jgi:signal peptidase
VSWAEKLGTRLRRRGVVLPVAVVALAVLLPVAILLATGFVLGWRFQPIETSSMEPRYPAGSLAVVVPIDPAEVEPGMTIAFDDPLSRDRVVAHRVVRQLPGDSLAWETKGDANAESDPLPVHATAVRGRVAWTIPGLGSLVTALRGPQAVLLLVILPLVVLAWTELAERRRRAAKPTATVAE